MLNIPWFEVTDITHFPDPTLSLKEPDGLLALGGNLSAPTLINAYKNGIFPWFSEDQPILWWSPAQRAIIETAHIHISKNMRKLLKQEKYHATADTQFTKVIQSCAKPSPIDTRSETWITEDMQLAYRQLHEQGYAHSIEVWNNKQQLVGGLYGVFVNNCFCGESMFSRESNASKVALIKLATFLNNVGCEMIDCQLPTEHLQSLGATVITRENFIQRHTSAPINTVLHQTSWSSLWQQYSV